LRAESNLRMKKGNLTNRRNSLEVGGCSQGIRELRALLELGCESSWYSAEGSVGSVA
jgi:hypothetical protein